MVYLGGPSFAPVYESKRSSIFPEAPDWHSRADGDPVPDWADVIIDFRLPEARTPFPEVLPTAGQGEVLDWESQAEGWALHGWAWTPQATIEADGLEVTPEGDEVMDKTDAVTVARFTDPQGFRFAFFLSQDRRGKRARFASGRLGFLLPTMRFVFLFGDTNHIRAHWNPDTQRVEGFLDTTGSVLTLGGATHPSRAYSLEALRDAVANPAGWFGTSGSDVDWQTLEVGGAFRPIVPARALLSWAAAGATSYEQVAHWVRAGLDGAEAYHWLNMNTPDPAKDPDKAASTAPATDPWSDVDIIEWFTAFGGGSTRRGKAAGFRNAGLTPEQGHRWQKLIDSNQATKMRAVIDTYEAAGWTPADVTALQKVLRAKYKTNSPGVTFSLSEVVKWAFLPVNRAIGYTRAGISYTEAAVFEEAGTPVDEDTLAMMAALGSASELTSVF